jgi:hypothetical protein
MKSRQENQSKATNVQSIAFSEGFPPFLRPTPIRKAITDGGSKKSGFSGKEEIKTKGQKPIWVAHRLARFVLTRCT